MRTTLLVLHVIGAGTWLGANLTQAVAAPQFLKAGGESAARWWDVTVQMGKVLYPPAAITLLVTGIFLVVTSNGGYSFGDPFVAVGFAMIVIGSVLGITYLGPKGEKAAELRRSGGDSAAIPVEQGLSRFGMLDTVLLVLTIVAMVARWGV